MTEKEKLGAELDSALGKCDLHDFPRAYIVSPRATESSDLKGGSMARKRFQRGCVVLKGQVWYGKYRDDVVGHDGTVTRVQRRTPLGAHAISLALRTDHTCSISDSYE